MDFLEYINLSMEELEKEEKRLIADERKDEANLVKIKRNVYGIAKSYYEVVKKTVGQKQFIEEYIRRVNIPKGKWQSAYEQAKEHRRVEQTVIEEIKIQTMEEILNKFQEVWQ